MLEGTDLDNCSLWDKMLADLSSADFGWIAIVILCFMISNLSRALRWNMLLKPLGLDAKLHNTFGSIMIAYFANLTIPRSGEIIRSVMISRYEDVEIEKAMGTIVTDRIIDVLSLMIAIGLAFILSFGKMNTYFKENMDLNNTLEQILSFPALAIVPIIGLSTIYLTYRNWDKLLDTMLGQKLYKIVSGFSDGIKSIKDVENVPVFIFHSVIIWTMYYVMTYLCFLAFAPTSDLGLIAGLTVFVFGSLGIVFPSPGGMGSYHYLVGEALGFYNIGGADAFSFAMIVFISINLFCNIFFGLIFIILLPIIHKKNTLNISGS
tara:strand:- start:632 stop:1591 length:960 start_codon:yes stop_codon:yes gene_type:complete